MISNGDVLLRPISPVDLTLLRRWQDDPAVMEWWGVPQPLLAHDAFEEDLAGRFRTFDDEGQLMIAVEGTAVGRIGFHHLDVRHASAELSLYLGEEAARGRGIAFRAMSAMLAYLFQQRGLERVELTTISTNDAALRLYERLGFRPEGRFRDHIFYNGVWHDEVAMAILREEWLEMPAGAVP